MLNYYIRNDGFIEHHDVWSVYAIKAVTGSLFFLYTIKPR